MSAQRVILAGGSGFIGSALTAKLVGLGFEVIVLARSPSAMSRPIKEIGWDGRTLGPWADSLNGAYAVVNLAGKSINVPFTPENRRLILESRLQATHVINDALAKCSAPPRVLIQASACGFYGNTGKTCDETCPRGEGFLAEVCAAWENAFLADPNFQPTLGTRRVILRIGVVLGPGGGALKPLEKLTRFFLGGTAGSGKQYVSWVHLNDLTEMFVTAIQREDLSGILNATAPNPVTNRELMRALRKTLHRPWAPPSPAFLVKLGTRLMGTDPSLALEGQRCIPRRLLAHGFVFLHPQLEEALRSILCA